MRSALGYTPLHVAAHYGQVEVARILLEAGATPDQEDLQVRDNNFSTKKMFIMFFFDFWSHKRWQMVNCCQQTLTRHKFVKYNEVLIDSHPPKKMSLNAEMREQNVNLVFFYKSWLLMKNLVSKKVLLCKVKNLLPAFCLLFPIGLSFWQLYWMHHYNNSHQI